MAKKSHAAKSKLRNKHQSKKNSTTKKKKKNVNKLKNQSVIVQKLFDGNSKLGKENGSDFAGDGGGILGQDASLDDIDYLLSNSKHLSFLSQDLENDEPPSKKKKKDASEETEYEKNPRKLGKAYHDDAATDRVHLLPIKNKDGLVRRSIAKEEREETSEPVEIEESNNELQTNIKEEMSLVEIYAERERTIRESKIAIATACEEILEDPESNMKNLKKLLEYCGKDQIVVIRKLALISLCEIFKDIVPGYRMRPFTEQEKSGRVSKEVKKLRDFEEGLVINYKKYLDVLEETVQDFVSKKNKKTSNDQTSQAQMKIIKSLAITAVTCMTDVLASLNHFNYRTNLIVAVVSKVNHGGDKIEISDICVEALKNLFRNDEVGDVSLEAMKVVSRMAKSSMGKLRPQVLETLLYLNIDVQMIKEAESRESKVERLKKRREELKKMSRKEKKRKRLESKLDKELQETEAVESRQKIQRYQTEILKFVFVIYFRVLKQERKTPLLTPVLKGLSKYAYLINVDFFGDLMVALNRLINSGELSLTESLSCVLTAFKILSGQSEVLNIDPHNFYLHLYNSLVDVASDCKSEDVELCIECLSLMLVKRRKQVSVRRILGFLKRIATISLQQDKEDLLRFMAIMRSVLQMNQKCDILLDNERLGRGVFQPEVHDPEHCNADSTALWELSMLKTHYSIEVNQYANHLLNGAPSQGQNSLPNRIAHRNEITDKSNPPLEHYFPENIPAEKKTKKTKIYVDRWHQQSFQNFLSSILGTKVKTETAFDFATYVR